MPKITWEGDKALIKALKERANMNLVKMVVKKHTADLQAKSMRIVPVDTGTLKRSIMLDISYDGLTGVVGATAHYGGYVEWGTRYQRAQPYIGPSFKAVKGAFISDLKKLV